LIESAGLEPDELDWLLKTGELDWATEPMKAEIKKIVNGVKA
jgi:hypothetical protein